MKRCVYCGQPAHAQNRGARDHESDSQRGLVCGKHLDLPELDPDWTTWRLQAWWLSRFSMDELRLMGDALELPGPPDDHLEPVRQMRRWATSNRPVDQGTTLNYEAAA